MTLKNSYDTPEFYVDKMKLDIIPKVMYIKKETILICVSKCLEGSASIKY